jgi:c(7)-type cytochrome triheme protein
MSRLFGGLGLVAMVLCASVAWGKIGGGDITFTAPGMPDVLYSHEVHVVNAKLKCTECHYAIYTNHAMHKTVGMEGMQKGRSCGVCHNGKRAFSVTDKGNCKKCHSK